MKKNYIKIYKITGYYGNYRTSHVAFTKEGVDYVVRAMEEEGIYRWINVTFKIIHTEKQISELNSYLASMGVY